MQRTNAEPDRHRARQLHPLPLRIMHWINAVAIFIMIGSGWKIYNDDILFSFLRFPDSIVIGKWAQYGLQWHFFGMWIFVLNGIAYLCYGIVTARLSAETLSNFGSRSFCHRRRCFALSAAP
jgi:thiosulfate reductase cytochrome b subunit